MDWPPKIAEKRQRENALPLGRKLTISPPFTVWDEDGAFLAKARFGPGALRLCLALIGISAVVFVVCVPYVRMPLLPSPAFVAIYNAVSTLNDLTTSVILFGQFSILRSRGLLVLAAGYLFAALMSVIQLLAFPGISTVA